MTIQKRRQDRVRANRAFFQFSFFNVMPSAVRNTLAMGSSIFAFLMLGALNLAVTTYGAPLKVWSDSDAWDRPRANFVNWENPHVHPLDITPDGRQLLAVNTADNSLLVFDVTTDALQLAHTIPVGLDPVSVRARTNSEAWVVNHVSDSVSVVDLTLGRVVAVLQTEDEPADVVFAGKPQRAFVSASQVNRLNVFDIADLTQPPQSLFINGEDPRALAVSRDGGTVYLAIFESGNGTTLLNGGKTSGCCEVDIVSDSRGPYGGVGIPPNDGADYSPPIGVDIQLPPAAPMIVRKNDSGRWIDDNNGDWTRFVSGDLSAFGGQRRGRVAGWDYPDRDVAVIDANSLEITYQTRLMNTLMALAVNPASGEVTVVGTDATNEIRWEPNLKSTFLRVNMARFANDGEATIVDLNPHLNYVEKSIPQAQRNLSIGDPRGVVWNQQGTRAYVTGMGSNNVVVIDADGARIANVEVGEGPTGIALDNTGARAFVLNRFDASISTINLNTQQVTAEQQFFDPTPDVIRDGRSFLYDTHATSGLGHTSCASCHVDGRTDRLAWDLGNPAGEMESLPGTDAEDSPVKGPMLTMTLQDIVGHAVMHWRGDRADLGGFEHAFVNLQGADAPLTSSQTDLFEAFLATITIPPNPNRAPDNDFSTQVQIPGPNGTIAGIGNAVLGAEQFENSCRGCHRGDSTRGTRLGGPSQFAIGRIRPPMWRNFHERFGLWYQSIDGSNSGFGFQQDGGFDSTHNGTRNDNMMAFMLSVNGRFPYTPAGLSEETQSMDTHAAVGRQFMSDGSAASSAQLTDLLALANRGEIGLVAHGSLDDETRGYTYVGNATFQSDRWQENISVAALTSSIDEDDTLVITAVPSGSETRIGVDRDMDGALNGDELDQGSDPAEPGSTPAGAVCADVSDIASSGIASQSSGYAGNRFPAALALDGDLGTFTHTFSGDTTATWTLDLDTDYFIESLILHNRQQCCGSRLRDLTVYVFDESGTRVQFRSSFLNRHNRQNSPSAVSLDLTAITGAPVLGSRIQVVRSSDPALIGTDGAGNSDEASVLSLAEVQVLGCPATSRPVPNINLLINGSFEEPGLSGNWQQFGSIPGWTSGAPLELQGGTLFNATAVDGNQWLELNAGGSGPWEISQTVATVPGRTYRLALSFAARPNNRVNEASVQIGSDTPLIMSAGPVATGVTWQPSVLTHLATDTSTTITFRSLSTSSLGNLIDDVSFVEVSQ